MVISDILGRASGVILRSPFDKDDEESSAHAIEADPANVTGDCLRPYGFAQGDICADASIIGVIWLMAIDLRNTIWAGGWEKGANEVNRARLALI